MTCWRNGGLAVRISWVMGAALWLGGCSAYNAANAPAPTPVESAPSRSAGRAEAGGVTLASWYGPGFIGQRTASGEIYHRDDLTAASRSLPLGSRVKVTNLDTGRSVVVRINDRGPYVRGRGIDLSERAARRIALNHSGVARVSVTRLDGTETASAADAAGARERWSGRARVSRRTSHARRRAHGRHARGYEYASAAGYRSPHRMVANPVGDWLLEMVR